VAARFQVKFATRETVQAWSRRPGHTLFMLDVRAREEFEEGRIAGSRHAAGGQVVQATDEYIGVRNAHVVLIDPARVRSVMTASWLNQMGWDHVYVLEPEGQDGFDGWPVERGPAPRRVAAWAPWQTITAQALGEHLHDPGLAVIDLATSLRFRERHIPGAWWAVRARLDQARAKLPDVQTLVLTSEDGVLAHLTAREAGALWPNAKVRVLDGGNAAWFAAGSETDNGIANATATLDDVWYKPYEQPHAYEEHARAYLTWEVALVDQIRRDPTIRFRAYD
jgi:rhodanese-related sulfurtransferase